MIKVKVIMVSITLQAERVGDVTESPCVGLANDVPISTI
jgi:hypothetical protein